MKAVRATFGLVVFCISVASCTVYSSSLFRDPSGKINKSSISKRFSVFATIYSGKEMMLGAPIEGMEENALIKIDGAAKEYHGIVADTVMVDGKADCLNPLYNQEIALLAVQPLGNHPIVVTRANPKNLYFVQHYQSKQLHNVLSLENIKDASGKESQGIIAIAAAPPNHPYIFAAVLGNEKKDFGEQGSGIAIIGIKTVEKEIESDSGIKHQMHFSSLVQMDALIGDKKKKLEELSSPSITVVDTNNGSVQTSEEVKEVELLVQAASLDCSSATVAINHPLLRIDNTVDMIWDKELGLLYVALQIENAPHDDAGGCAVLVLKQYLSGNFIVESIAPAQVFSQGAENEIVGSIGSCAPTTIHKIRTMHNSSELPYLIVLGGNGNPEQTNNTVYALPIYGQLDAAYGTLAKKDAGVERKQFPSPKFVGRCFTTPALTADDIYKSDDKAASVGGGPLREGAIDTIMVHGDLVCATVSQPAEGCLPGMFFSRALLNEQGAIAGWTVWQRMGGITDPLIGAVVNETNGSIIFVKENSDEHGLEIRGVSWKKKSNNTSDNEEKSDNSSSLEKTINNYFADGIAAIIDFPADVDNKQGSHLVIVGHDKLALIKSGSISAGTVVPTPFAAFTEEATEQIDGVLQQSIDPQKTIAIFSGEVLKEIAPLTSFEIIRNDEQEWLMVGGINGLAVLCRENGDGISLAARKESLLDSLMPGMRFKKISTQRFIRKIIADRNNVYILTPESLQRIGLTKAPFSQTNVQLLMLASRATFPEKGIFFDLLISEKIALIGTSKGLFRIGDDKDVAHISSAVDAGWTQIALKDPVGSILQIEAHSATGRPQDVSRFSGGMLYLLDASKSKDSARLHRLAIKSSEFGRIQHDTVLPALDTDYSVKNMTHATFTSYRKKIVTDGSLFLSIANYDKKPRLISGGKIRGHINDVIEIPDFKGDVESLVRDSASGKWFLGGTFGLFIYE